MKILFRISLVILLLYVPASVCGQSLNTISDKAYGLDPLLYNGILYTYLLPPGTSGTPFFNGPDFVKGFVTLRGLTYDDLWLKYDVFNQQLILQYKTSTGADNQIIISDAWLEKFNLGNTHFELLAIQDTLKRIYQVMGTSRYHIIYFWSKEEALDSRTGATNRVFTLPKKESYLLTGMKMYRYVNNRSFIALFDPAKRAMLKKHLRQQKINVKKASDLAITELINYCNTLSLK